MFIFSTQFNSIFISPLDIKRYFKDFFTIYISQKQNSFIFNQNLNKLKSEFKLPFQEELEQVIKDQESQREDRIKESQTDVKEKKEAEMEVERIFWEKGKPYRKDKSMAEFWQFQDKMREDIERQFEEGTFQEPESQFLKFKSFMDPSFRNIPKVPDEFKDPILVLKL